MKTDACGTCFLQHHCFCIDPHVKTSNVGPFVLTSSVLFAQRFGAMWCKWSTERTQPCGMPVLRVIMKEIRSLKVDCSVCSLFISFLRLVEIWPELKSTNSTLKQVFGFSRWKRAVWSAMDLVPSLDQLALQVNWSWLMSGVMDLHQLVSASQST